MTEGLYTPKQVSEMLSVTTRTVRRYASRYPDLLSEESAERGTHRKYTDADILVLRKIKLLTQQHLPPDEVRQQIDLIDPETQQTALVLLPEVLTEFENLRAVIASQQQTINGLEDRIAELEKPWYQRIFKNRDQSARNE